MAYTTNELRRAEALLGYGIQNGSGQRKYVVVDDVVYTDLFQGEPTIDGYTGTITKRFNGRYGTTYFNEIVLEPHKCKREVTVGATWGSSDFLAEIDELLEWIHENPFTEQADNAGIKSVKIEDFSATQGTAEETKTSFYDALRASWSFYIRNPLIISVTPEQRDDYRHF